MSLSDQGAPKWLVILMGSLTISWSLFGAASDEALNQGIDCLQGRVTAKDIPQGLKLLEASADQGNAKAQKLLGVIFSSGEIVPVNEAQAAKYFKQAADSGDALSQSTYGSCLLEGAGVPKDPNQAVTYFMKSAMQGNCDGLVNLGRCYGTGVGVEQNLVEAYKFIGVASQLGDKEASAMLPLIKEKMTPGQFSLAQKDIESLLQEIKNKR